MNLLLVPLDFVLKTLLISIYRILPNRLYFILLVMFQLNSNIMLFVNLSYHFNLLLLMWISHPCLCQCVNVVRLVFCDLHISFLAKPFFITVNLVHPVTVYNVKPVNSARHICRVFPSALYYKYPLTLFLSETWECYKLSSVITQFNFFSWY